MRPPLLTVQNLVKDFGDFRAVDGVSFELAEGEILGLLGPNGAGKTTVMNMLLGLISANSGSIRIFGKPLETHRIQILRRMNFSSAYTSLPGNLLVRQNLTVFAMLYGIRDWRSRVRETMERFGVADLADRITGHLSAGEATRVNLCKAFLNRPELLLLDEPTASLDPDVVDKVRTLIRETQREAGTSIIYTSHNMQDIELVCDRVLFLHRGKVIRMGTPDEIKASFDSSSLEDVFIQIARGGDLEIAGDR
ncbi:MAG: ABC-2 type transport system ATP-binding protein [Verrucomicrobia bacterium]|nr:MAG: ABC-2 type transport system ATP-binding protein [Verrucomicrobiota bacterium]